MIAINPLHDFGWNVETVSWRSPYANWSAQKDPAAFLSVLKRSNVWNMSLSSPHFIFELTLKHQSDSLMR
ncbi:MAG: hypothetical protein H0V76_08445 [Blastocatellia bacterium]|nr:hypothetical protein [Blastocatellia bacterium]